MKYVLVSGGVISGIGKGIIASSTGLLLKTIGLKATAIKIDPYLNVDAGTMGPLEHGECFVLDDGGEVDLDLGNYERYMNITLTRENSITTGRMYQLVIQKERRGDYLGKTVQVVPHITNAIQDTIEEASKKPVDDTKEEPDVCIIELGGTVGDIESAPFIEAMRQLRRRAGRDNFAHIHVSLVPVISGEQKTKPTQQAIREARAAGLAPDLIACRCQEPLAESTINKIAMFCQVEPIQVLAVHDVESTYHVPLLLEQQKLIDQLHDLFRLDAYTIPPPLVTKGQQLWTDWKKLTVSQERFLDSEKVSIALVGKYTNLHDSYLSVIKALEHSAMACQRKLNLIWIDSEDLEKANMSSDPKKYHKAWHLLCGADGVLVPGGFGTRGTEGMIEAAKWARTEPKPYLGICYGLQLAVLEYARNVCGLESAQTMEIDKKAAEPVVIEMPEVDQENLGGTMRLGLRPTLFQEDTSWSRLRKLYNNAPAVNERHRHRFEVNPEYVDRISDAGLTFIGKDEAGERMEMFELKDHPWFVGVQFHPEYLSRVLQPSPPYLGFVAASAGVLEKVTAENAVRLATFNDDAAGQVHGAINGNGINGLANGVKVRGQMSRGVTS